LPKQGRNLTVWISNIKEFAAGRTKYD